MQLTPDLLVLCLAWYAVFVFSTTLHEGAHALAALRMGDPTAYHGGQVTLSPVPHIQREPFGMVVVPLLSFFLMGGAWMIGWASAPYDPQWAERYPKRSAWMAAAGPAANLLLVAIAGLIMRIALGTGFFTTPERLSFSSLVAGSGGGASEGLALVLSVLFLLNLVLFLFNLLPLPPMDGSAVVQLFLSDDAARSYQAFLRQPMWALVGLVLAWRFFPTLFSPVLDFALRLLYG